MAVSRRFETRFKIYARRTKLTYSNYKQMFGNISDTTATSVSRLNIGVPSVGNAFVIQYNSTAGWWYFVASNRASAYNGLSVYPATYPAYTDAIWGRVPHAVTWYDNNSTPVLTGAASGRYVHTVGTDTRYAMTLAFQHHVDIINNTNDVFRIWTRDFGGVDYVLSGELKGWPGLPKFTAWQAVDIPANESYLFKGFEPMEIKVNRESSPAEIYGLTRQDGDKFILRGNSDG